MEEEIVEAAKGSTKLRFLKPGKFERASYFHRFTSDDAQMILKIRLNMVNIYGNYKSDIRKKRTCPHCKQNSDTTEHLVECPGIYEGGINGESI